MRSLWPVAIALAALVAPSPQERPAPPLPKGAIASFGSDRLRHAAWITSVAISPDGRRIASAAQDDLVKLWDAATGALTAVLRGHTAGVLAVAFSPNGRWIASAGGDATVRLFDAESGAEVARFGGFEQAVLAVAFSPDGKTLAAGSYDRSVRLFDVAERRERARHDDPEFGVRSLAYSPDGTTLAAGTWGEKIVLLDAATARERRTLATPGPGTFALAYTPDGRRLAAGGDRGALVLFDVESGAAAFRLEGHAGAVYAAAVAPDGKSLASGGDDGALRVHDLASGRLERTIPGRPAIVSIAIARDGSRLAAGAGPALRVFALPNLERLPLSPGHEDEIRTIAVSPSGALVATASGDSTVRVFDRATGAERRAIEVGQPVDAVAFDGGEKLLAVARRTGRVGVIDLETGTESPRFDLARKAAAVAFSSDGGRFAALGPNSVSLHDARTGASLTRIDLEEGLYSSVALFPGGSPLALGRVDGTIEMRHAATDRVEILPGPRDRQRVVALAISRDGLLVASASLDGRARVSNAKRPAPARVEFDVPARSLAFSPDGDVLAAGLADTRALLLDVAARRPPR